VCVGVHLGGYLLLAFNWLCPLRCNGACTSGFVKNILWDVVSAGNIVWIGRLMIPFGNVLCVFITRVIGILGNLLYGEVAITVVFRISYQYVYKLVLLPSIINHSILCRLLPKLVTYDTERKVNWFYYSVHTSLLCLLEGLLV